MMSYGLTGSSEDTEVNDSSEVIMSEYEESELSYPYSSLELSLESELEDDSADDSDC